MIKSLEALDRVEQEQLRLKAQTEAQAATIFSHDNRLDVIEAKQDAKLLGCQYFAIMGYANLHRIRLDSQTAAKYGREATKISKRDEIMTGTVPDAKYGEVKSYHIDVLDEVFADLI